MKPLPSLNQDTVIELAREGGFAFIPKLAGQRRIALADITPEQRQRLSQLLNQTLPYAQEEGKPGSPAAATSATSACKSAITARICAVKSSC